MKVLAPGSVQRNRTSVIERNVPSPGPPVPSVRSRVMSYAGHVEQAGPLGGLDLGQVAHSGHCSSPSHVSPRPGGSRLAGRS